MGRGHQKRVPRCFGGTRWRKGRGKLGDLRVFFSGKPAVGFGLIRVFSMERFGYPGAEEPHDEDEGAGDEEDADEGGDGHADDHDHADGIAG